MARSITFAIIGALTIWHHLAPASAFPTFDELIPNSKNVPNPCNRQRTVAAIGHANFDGGLEMNPFGRDFTRQNFTWQLVCPLDSDGDGLTNGQELGDPYCLWRPFQDLIPTVTNRNGLSHPGVCEPLEAPTCQQVNSFLDLALCPFQPLPQPTTTRRPPPPPPVPAPSPILLFPAGFVFCANNEQPWRVPRTLTEARQCDTSNPCPTGYGCVVGPTQVFEMSICCPVPRPPVQRTVIFLAPPPPPPPTTTLATRAPCPTTTTTTTTTTTPPPPPPPAPTFLRAVILAPVPPPPQRVVFIPASTMTQSPIEWCFSEADTGPCRNMIVAWYYNVDTDRCWPFAYGGCVQTGAGERANRGSFATRADCETTCKALRSRV